MKLRCMRTTLRKVLTMAMIVMFVLSTVPQAAYAQKAERDIPSQQNLQVQAANSAPVVNYVETGEVPVSVLSEQPTEPSILAEDTRKRTEFSKEFIRSDSSHLMVLYPEAVHYEKNGKWEDVDNTLVSRTDKDGNEILQNTASSVDIRLPVDFKPGGAPVSISKNGYTLGFILEGAYNTVKSAVKAADKSRFASVSDDHKKTIPTKLESSVQYSDVLPNIDIEYSVQPEQLKESVIVKSLPVKPLVYTYKVIADRLTPVLQKDKSINFYPEGKTDGDPAFIMPAPYMVDADGEVNYDVAVTLDTANNQCRITYAPSMEWMGATDRAWPVIIDPVVVADLSIDNIRDKQVDSNKDDVSHTSAYIEAGYHSTYGKERIYLMYDNLPALSAADVVVDSYVQIYRPYNSTVVSQMEVHKVNAAWESETLQWSNQPSFDISIVDYQLVQNANWYTWHITDIAREWYAGSNTGMMFKLPDSVENGTVAENKTFYSSDNGSGARPVLYIAFRNNCGLENYWNYHTQDVGRAGTGYVNDFTGNLVFKHQDIGYDGELMPVAIEHVYNANDKSNNSFGCGYGWRTNFNQKVYQWSVDSTYYVWEDEDGTRHYFKYDSANTYKDEDGLSLTLKNNETGNYKYSITDLMGNKRYFDTYGRLRRLQNNQATASYIDITYTTTSGLYINTITDGADRVYQFVYSGSNLARIDYKGTGSTALQDVAFAYNANTELTTITHNDSKTTSYAYTSNHLLNKVTDIDGYYVKYTYNTTSTSLPNRVAKLEYFDNAVAGSTLTFAYSHNQTIFTDYRGRKITEQFNDMGNTICVQDDQGNAQYAGYAKDTDSDSGKANQLTTSSKLQNTVVNYLKNSNCEYSDGWTLYNDSSATGSWSYSTAEEYIGTKSLAITRSNEVGIYRLQQSITLTKGKTYTLSGWIKTTGMSGTGAGAQLVIQCQTTQGAYPKAYSPAINTNSDWQRVEATFTVPSDSYSDVLTFMCYQGSNGTAYFDCLQVEEAPTASRYNLVENGDFRNQGTTYSDALYWTELRLTSSDIRTPSESPDCVRLDTNSFKITGDASTNKNLYQSIQIPGAAGDVFTLSGWAKGDSVPLDVAERHFELNLKIHYTDGTDAYFSFPFNASSTDWQYVAGRATAAKAYTHIVAHVLYFGNANTVYFDGIQAYREEFGSSFAYDANGNPTSIGSINNDGTKNNSKTDITYTNNNPTSITDAAGNKTTNTFDGYHNMLSSKTPNEKTTTAYAGNGNPTSVKKVDPDDSAAPTIESNTTYTANGNYIDTTVDDARNTTTYGYGSQYGTLLWLQAPEDTQATRTVYDYDSMNRMTSVSKPVSGLYNGVAEMQSSYTYEDDSIKTISHNNTTSGNDTTYTFNYGNMGTLTNVQVGSGTPRTLVTNTYETSNRSYNLLKATYGNGDFVQYAYDLLDRVTGIKYEGDSANRFSMMYNNAGDIGSLTDNANNLFTKYNYDMGDRLKSITETGINGRDYDHTYTWSFDLNRNVSNVRETVNSGVWGTTYSYDGDNRLTALNYNYGSRSSKTAWTYDPYGRVSARNVFDNNTTQIFDTTYTYSNPSSTHTSSLVRTVQNKRHTAGGFNETLTYQYDAGKIISVADGSKTTSYDYDGANQLIRENNQAAGKTWTWSYDAGGNIRQKKEYAYTTGTLGTALSTKTYSYTDSRGWGDLLTSYNGAAITYDGLGNPLSDGTWTYTWQGGRNLAGMSKTGTTISYKYNKDGIRTSKTVNGVTTTYTLVGDKVTHETNGTNGVYYRYDSGDKLNSMSLNGTAYYYFRNAQGDIIGLFDNAGTVVVEYTYDAWGNILSTTGSLASTVGEINPYRYRGYRFDEETGLYYLQSRYYSPVWGRFISADSQISGGGDLTGLNLFAYCGNSPVNRSDPSGHAWWHWAIAAVVVAAVAVAVVATAGGALPAVLAVAAVASGGAAATTAATVAAGAFIGASMALGVAALSAAASSGSPQEFAAQGNWGTVAATAGGALLGGASGYSPSKGSRTTTAGTTPKSAPASAPKAAPRFNADQNALIKLAKENRKGISMSNAKILEGWGNEYGVRAEIHMGHPNRPSIVSQNPHFHFGNGSDHVPIFPEY